jgi:hypothetical protein
VFVRLRRISTLRTLGLAGGAFGILASVYLARIPELVGQAMGYRGNVDVWAIDTGINPSPATAYGFLSAWGSAGRRAVVFDHVVFDYLFPLALAVSLAIALSLLAPRLLSTSPWRWVLVLPFLGCLMDWLENAGIIAMAASFPTRLDLVARTTSALTVLKFSFDLLAFAVLLVGVGVLLVCWVRVTNRRRDQSLSRG